jgi:hypothetical protein
MDVLVNYGLIQPTPETSHLRPTSSASWMCLTRRASVSRKRLASTILYTSMRASSQILEVNGPPISSRVHSHLQPPPTPREKFSFRHFSASTTTSTLQRGTKIVYDDLRRHTLSKNHPVGTPTAQDRKIAARTARFSSNFFFAHDHEPVFFFYNSDAH